MSWTLITIPYSHYCEKARWALDLAQVRYRERGYLPGLHMLATRLRRRGRSVPVLIAGDVCHTDSTAILRFVDEGARGEPRLYPAAAAAGGDAAAVEDWLDEELGPATRLLAYHHLLQDPRRLVELVGRSYAWPLRTLFSLLAPLLGRIIRNFYRIEAASAARSLATVRSAFARVDGMLADGRPFLLGASFSAADLTFAALAAPVLFWPEMSFQRSGAPPADAAILATLPADLQEIVRELRATRAGAHCLRVYRECRRPPFNGGKPLYRF